MFTFNIPVAKRTRLQTQRFMENNPGFNGSKRNRSRKRNGDAGVYEVIEIIDDDDHHDANEDLQTSCKLHHGSENSKQAGSFQLTKDDEHESVNASENRPTKKEKMKKIDQNVKEESSDGYVHGKTVAECEAKECVYLVDVDGLIFLEEQKADRIKSQKKAKTSSLQSSENESIVSDDTEFSSKYNISSPSNIKEESSDGNVHGETVAECEAKECVYLVDVDGRIFLEEQEADVDVHMSLQSSENESDDSDDTEFSPEDKNQSFMKRTDKKPMDELNDYYVHEKTVAKGKAKDCSITVDEIREDDELIILEEQEEADGNESQKNVKASSFQSTEDEISSESESESDDSDDFDFVQENKRLHQSMTKNQRSHKGKDWAESVDRKENAKEKHVKGHYKKVDKANPIKYKKSDKGRRRDDAGGVDAILDSIIYNKDVDGKKENKVLSYKFKFDDSEDESLSEKADEFDDEAKRLFEEMDFAQTCDEVGSYKTPKVENSEKDDYYDDIDPCERGEHGDTYYEEQIGMRCGLCGAVLLESRYVIPKLATYTPAKFKRSYRFDEQRYSFSPENFYATDSNCNNVNNCKQTTGTVWELIAADTQAQMHSHQQEGFEFLWHNLAGTIDLSELQTLDTRGGGGNGGGCIISHAPGTGKTFLAIVFIESFLKKFPKCCPVIVAPASMLLTWEAEFKKWQVEFSFINLNNSECLRKEMTIGGSRYNKDLIRAIKIRSWINGGSVLGLSYNLFEKLAGDSNNSKNSNEKNTHREKMRKFLLDMPGIVVLDEGHTPRNENSNIWNTLLKLKTRNRVILSGTPFQNNFKELFNTLRIVRPAAAKSIGKDKFFADMIQKKNMKDIEKFKETISPFVHVHKGDILESKLPGLKQSVILLNPPSFQKGFLQNLGNSVGTFAYEHKVALVSVHPSLILHCKEEKLLNKQELENVRLQPAVGVKTRFVMELIRLSLSLNEKVLIFSQYIQPSELLQEQIARAFSWDIENEITFIKGKIHQTRRQKVINAFNDPKSDLKVLLASTKCCSEGIHLYGGSRVVLLDIVWNPSVEKQAISRAYRLGQKKVVYTYHLMAAGTTEEEKYDRQVEKGRLAEMVFSSASVAGAEPKNKVNVDDKILQHMVDDQKLEDMFMKITYVENQTRI